MSPIPHVPTRPWFIMLLSSIPLLSVGGLVLPTTVTRPATSLAASRVPTNEILGSAAPIRPTKKAASVRVSHPKNDNGEKLPSFLGSTISASSPAIVDTDPADRSRSIRRFSAKLKKPTQVDDDKTNDISSTLLPWKRRSAKKILAKVVPKSRASIVKAVAIAATITSLFSFGRKLNTLNSNGFEHIVINDEASQAVLMSDADSDPFSALPVNTKVRGGTKLGTIDDTEAAAFAESVVPANEVIVHGTNKDDVVFTSGRGGGQVSVTTATHTATFQSYDELSPTTKHTIEVLCKAAVIIAGVSIGKELSKPRTPRRKMTRKMATSSKSKASEKMKANILALASTLERSIKSNRAKARKEEKLHRSLLEAQLRYTAADQTRKRLDDMTTQFARLRDEHNKLLQASFENKSMLEDDLSSATMRLALAETSATGLSRELKRLTGLEMTLRKEVEQLKSELNAATKANKDLQINLSADLKDAQWENKSLKEEIEKLKEEVEDLRNKLKEKEISSTNTSVADEAKVVKVEPVTSSTDYMYGNPYLPLDIEENDEIKSALQAIKAEGPNSENMKLLETAGTDDAATLTLTGYKGGGLTSKQVNQDRALIIAPFLVGDEESSTDSNNRLMCVFDGHNSDGEIVSEFATRCLPDILSRNLKDLNKTAKENKWNDEQRVVETKKVLTDTFLEVHSAGKTELATNSGGCTASVVLKLGDKVYIANAGDTQSIVATYTEATGDIAVNYVTREDTPDLDDEMERIEKKGGVVQYVDGSSRVIYFDENDVARGGLAISRALGDWDLSDYGVIPDPIVDVIDLKDVTEGTDDGKVQVFAVAASDGLLEFIDRADFLCRTVEGLYVPNKPDIFTAMQDMIVDAKKGWFLECGDEYRDDITIAATKLIL